jgi:leader peptidase (prepilin peptidase) / N-methyltransferase
MSFGWGLAGFTLGAIVGSFLATAAIRWPAGRSTSGRSACDRCGRRLTVLDLVPVLGFAIRRGRCASCGEAIDRRHLAIEIAAALVGALAFALAPGIDGIAGAIFGWFLLLLGVLDVEHFWLPDRATGLMALTGIAAGAAGADPYPNDRLIGMAAGFLSLWLVGRAYLLVRKREGLGGGDPKLFGATGAWLGWAALPFVLLMAALVGLAAVLSARMGGKEVRADTRLPFGALLAVAAWAVWIVQAGGQTS